MKLHFSWVLLALGLCLSSHGYRICGDDYGKEDVKKATDEILNRLMALRNTDWNWQLTQTIMTIQIAGPERFIGREKTVEALKKKLRTKAKNMTLMELGLHAVAVKSLCHNPSNFSGMNLMDIIEQRLLRQFGYRVRVPKDGYQAYAIGLTALCLSNYPVRRYLVNKLLASQNNDGSFGISSSTIIATTSFLLPPLSCVSQETNPAIRVTRLDAAIRKMRKFLKSKVHTDLKNNTYLGNAHTSTLALMGLRLTQERGESPDSWKCREIVQSLGIFPDPQEPEAFLVSRLRRITGHGFFYFKDPEWKCIDPVPIPPGYKPNCQPALPETCGLLSSPKQKNE